MNLLESEKEVFTLNEVSEFLRLNRITVTKIIKNGELGGFKAGGQYLITKLALKHFLGIK